MSDPSDVISQIESAQDAFEYTGLGTPEFEENINQDNNWKKQLTKSCRYLQSSQVLRNKDGFNGAVIELCFGSIERALEAYLLWATDDNLQDYQDHEYVYERAADQGLFDYNTADDLKNLYGANRTEHYYGGHVPTQQKEDAMYSLARSIHTYIRDQIREGSICVCDQ